MHTTTQTLIPKSGNVLQVIALGRISTIHQDIDNIEASYRYIQDYLSRIYEGPLTIKFLGEQASGMRTDRTTIREAEELIASGMIDLVIAEDLSRIYRNPRHQYDFVQNAVDIGTRVICIGDNLDTADENWEITMGAAALRHGLHIPDTRRRVRRTATHSFHQGGMVQKIRYGYRKLSEEEAAAGNFGSRDLRIAKRPECTPVIREMMDRVLRGESYASITDWLDSEGIEPGPYVTSRRWSARLVAELLADPILAGTRTFRDTICRPIFKTGRHKSAKNAEPETKHYDELAHMTPPEHQALLTVMAARKAEFVARTAGSARRRGMVRSRTLWPGQSLTCAICGGLMYFSGNHLRCCNSFKRAGKRCWNRVHVMTEVVRERMVAWLASSTAESTAYRDAFAESIWPLVRPQQEERASRESARRIEILERQAANLTAAIAEGGRLEVLLERLKGVEAGIREARTRSAAASAASNSGEFRSKAELARRMPQVLTKLIGTSFAFADLLRKLVPVFKIQPVQAFDTPLVRPRGKFSLCVAALHPALAGMEEGRQSVMLDLFEPPVHVRALGACLAARANDPKISQRRIAALLNLNGMTVKRTFDYARRMEQAGSADPYREISDPPAGASRWRTRSSTRRPTAEVECSVGSP